MRSPGPALIVHGHFYQPPRENPWTGVIDQEVSAAPFQDWNERIFRECYRANAYARVVDEAGYLVKLVNNFEHLSFNLGPTLLSWLERAHPATYTRILEADRVSATRRGGHGNAIAQGYNHCILPLGTPRDQRTQVRWGVRDFAHRFKRPPEGFWLPETAASHDVLDILVEEGLRYTILSPYQAGAVRPLGDEAWQDVTGGRLDPTRPYRYLHSDGSGRGLDIVFYDGPLSKGIAFEGALLSSQAFLDTLARGRGDGPMVNVATDGESYGHHFRFGDRTLAHALEELAPERGLEITNYGALLDRHPPKDEVRLWEGPDGRGSSWSCAHGVGRWFRDCGCHTGGRTGWTQAWRGPLREALDFLRDSAGAIFEERGEPLFEDPWAARDAYVDVLLTEKRGPFFEAHARRTLNASEQVEALTLLEMQHQTMLMYTSCGWFFADLAGIETQQLLKYAGRAIDFVRELGHESPLDDFLQRLAAAKSNIPEQGNGADIYNRYVTPARVSPRRLAAHISLSGLLETEEQEGTIAGYAFQRTGSQKEHHGHLALATTQVQLTRKSTGREYTESTASLHLGGVDFYCAVRNDLDSEGYRAAAKRLWETFTTGSLTTLMRRAAEEFGQREFSLEHMLPGGAQRVAESVMTGLLNRFSDQYAYLYEDHRRTLEMLRAAGVHLPKELTAAAEITLGRRFDNEIVKQKESRDPKAYRRAISIAEHAFTQGFRLDPSLASSTFTTMLNQSVLQAIESPDEQNLRTSLEILELIDRLHLDVSLAESQEALHQAMVSDESFQSSEFSTLLERLKLRAPTATRR